jgi:hypothetical protein
MLKTNNSSNKKYIIRAPVVGKTSEVSISIVKTF